MTTISRSQVDPGSLQGRSVGAIVAAVLLGLGWAIGAAWSVLVAETRIDPPNVTEDMTPPATILLMLLLWAGALTAGALWAVWQRGIAVAAIRSGTVRDPDWHAYAWFAPIVMWWEPLRNMLALTRIYLPARHRWLVPVWWVAWIPFRLMPWVLLWQFWMPARLLLPPRMTAIAVLGVAGLSTILAVTLVWQVTQAALARVRAPYLVDYVKRPFPMSLPLFVTGIVCRAATPIVVIVLLGEISMRFS